MTYSVVNASTTTALGYSTQRHIEALCDGTYVVAYQSSATTVNLEHVSSPSGTPSFSAVTQTFTISGAVNTIADIFVLNNGTTTSDVWVAYSDNNNTVGLYVAHGTYTASGASWSWDNTGTSIALGSYVNGYMVPSICWNGTNLIVIARGGISNYGIVATYTTTKNGSTGWAAVFNLDGGALTSHCYPLVLHDATNGITVCVYTLAADTVYARVLADTSTPSLGNWSAAVALSGTVGVGAANLSATLDTANKRLHVCYINTSSSTNPQYNTATYTATSLSAGTSFSAGNGGTTAYGSMVGLDGSGNAWVFWASGAVGAASDIMYAKIASPYTSAGAATNLTNASANDNGYPHVPVLAPFSGYIPVLFALTAGSFTVEYDNSITLTATLNGQAAIKGNGHLSAQGTIAGVSQAAIRGSGHFGATPSVFYTKQAHIQGAGHLAASTGTAGTGIGDLTVSTKTQSWPNSTTGAGSGTETDITYQDGSGSGWTLGMIPTYGGDLFSSKYERTNHSDGVNQASLSTTTSGGHVHWLEQSLSAYAGSEDKAFTLTELAPTGTPFRRYYKGTFGPDANGFNWNVTACVYPGDPGLVAYRYDCINPSSSAITLAGSDGMEVALIGSMEQTDSSWAPTNGFYGQVGGTTTTGWPGDGTGAGLIAYDPDFVGITPTVASGHTLGFLTVKQQRLASFSPTWANPQIVYLQNTSRLKLKVQGDISSFPGSTTQTMYLLVALRRGLTTTDAAAIAADYLAPGTPATTKGTFTSYSYDERAYQFTAAANNVTATLDFSPAHVTVRYKPVFKVTGWTGSIPALIWNGTVLTSGTDFRYVIDSTNQILYVQCYFDVVSSGAGSGQRNNAQFVVQSAVFSGQAAIQGHGHLAANNRGTNTGQAAIQGQGKFGATGQVQGIGRAGIQGHGQFVAFATQVHAGQGAIQGYGRFSADLLPSQTSLTNQGKLQGRGHLGALGHVTVPLPSTTPLATALLQQIVDNIAQTYVDLQTTFAVNPLQLPPTIPTMQAGVQSLVRRVSSLTDITQEAALSPGTFDAAQKVMRFLTLNQTYFYPLYAPLLAALDAYTGGLAAALVAQNIQVHPTFATVFNYVAQYAPTLGVSNQPLQLIGPQSVFMLGEMALGIYTYATASTGSYSSLASVNSAQYGNAPLSLKNVGTSSIGAGWQATITYQQWDGSLHTLLYTLPSTLAVGALISLGVMGTRCTGVVPTTSEGAQDALAVMAEPLRTISY